MKKIAAILASGMLCLLATACTPSNDEYYQHAQLYLGAGEYAQAAMLFDQLGEYEQAAEYALYCAGLDALAQGDTALARANLTQVDPFKSSGRYLQLLDAMALEEAGQLESALAAYTTLGSFAMSHQRAQHLREAIPQRDLAHARTLMEADRWEQALAMLEKLDGYGNSKELLAQCQEEITRQAYESAEKLYARGAYEQALAAFESLGDVLDARARALMCRSAMYQQLEQQYRRATLATAGELMARYAEMEDYLDSPQRLEALKNRYETNLRLLSAASAQPYVRFSSYPTEESGADGALTWRVIALEGSVATLLCENVVDAMPVASAAALALDLPPSAALSLPSRKDLEGLDSTRLSTPATPYALAQGVRSHSDGRAWWWLADVLPGGRHAIVWYNGQVIDTGVDLRESTVGVRPLLKMNLEEWSFTGGSGTQEDPFF